MLHKFTDMRYEQRGMSRFEFSQNLHDVLVAGSTIEVSCHHYHTSRYVYYRSGSAMDGNHLRIIANVKN